MIKKIKVLIVDDSALARDILSAGLSRFEDIEVIGTARDVYVARDKIVLLKPDVVTLDIEMPRMDGVEFLQKLMPQYPIPVVVVSSLTQTGKQVTIDALEAGAIDFISKPSANLSRGLATMLVELREKIKVASKANVAYWKGKKVLAVNKPMALRKEASNKILAIGASTGGTEAIRTIVKSLPANMCGIVIVQHMPPGFTNKFAESLNKISLMQVKEAENDEQVTTGKILIAPGDFHIEVVRSGSIYNVLCKKGEKISGHRPSVDVMMASVARNVGANAYGVMLTGMGSDGARGMRAMKEAGSFNIAQDESTSVVFGMPRVAYESGAVDRLMPIDKIASFLIKKLEL